VKSFGQPLRPIALSILVALLLAGCASLPPSNLMSFSCGVSAARNQTSVALQAVTELTSDALIDYAVAQATLADTNFFPVLPPESVAVWDAAFAGLQKYSQDLVLLTSANVTKDYENAVATFSDQLRQTGDDLKSQKLISSEPSLSPSLAAAFTELGSMILRAKVQHDARVILRQSDPAVRQILRNMADAIASNQDTALRGTVHAHWEEKKANLKVAFLSAAKPEERRNLAARYASLLVSESTQDLALASLQRSLLALIDAHHALANGDSCLASVSMNGSV